MYHASQLLVAMLVLETMVGIAIAVLIWRRARGRTESGLPQIMPVRRVESRIVPPAKQPPLPVPPVPVPPSVVAAVPEELVPVVPEPVPEEAIETAAPPADVQSAAAPDPAAPAPDVMPEPEPAAAMQAEAAPPDEPAEPSQPLLPPGPPADDELQIEGGRPVRPTPMTMVWGLLGKPPERYGIVIDSVSRDTLVFSGIARRLDLIQVVPGRRLFHTMRLPHERLLAAHDAADMPIENIRDWLAALLDA